jgi:hypothetical protein
VISYPEIADKPAHQTQKQTATAQQKTGERKVGDAEQ